MCEVLCDLVDAGGLERPGHHAMAGNASGFCVYYDPAIAIAWPLGQGAERIAYVDVDAHHGNGVERAFWDDPRVLTIGLHEHPPCSGGSARRSWLASMGATRTGMTR